MLDKNPKHMRDGTTHPASRPFWRNKVSMILCTDPLDKMKFLEGVISATDGPVTYVDADLLYTGYVRSGMLTRRDRVTIYNPEIRSWGGMLADIIERTSKNYTNNGNNKAGEATVILDSFNGISAMFGDDLAATRFTSSCTMLLSYLGCRIGATDPFSLPPSVVITVVTRRKRIYDAGLPARTGAWTLSPSGRRIMRAEGVGTHLLSRAEDGSLVVSSIKRPKHSQDDAMYDQRDSST